MSITPDPLDDVLRGVGDRLRQLRQDAGLTLVQLAETTGISVSTLSRLESAQRKPTLELLLPLAHAYGVALDDLVQSPDVVDPRIEQRPFTHHGSTYVPLSRHPGALRAYKQIIPGRRAGDVAPTQGVHDGYDWIYVLSGRLQLLLADRTMILEAGEAAEFDTRLPHAFHSAGPEPVELLNLFGDHGERVHVRASARPAQRRD